MNEWLWQFGQQLPAENKFQAVLKVALMRKSLNTLDPGSVTNGETMCRMCYTPWADGNFSVVILPRCKRSIKQAQQLEQMGELTKQQQSLLNYLKTRIGRVAKYTCQICSYKTRVSLDQKAKWVRTSVAAQPTKEELFQATYNEWMGSLNKKRKRPGKSSAGLKLPPKTLNNTTSNPVASLTAKPAPKTPAKGFHPSDFRLVQELLASNLSTKTTTKPK